MSIIVNTSPTAVAPSAIDGNNNAIVAKLVAVKPMISVPSGLIRGATFKLKDNAGTTYLVKSRRSYNTVERSTPAYSTAELVALITKKLRVDEKEVAECLEKIGAKTKSVQEKTDGEDMVSCNTSSTAIMKLAGLKENYNLFLLPSNRIADKSRIAEFTGLSVDEEADQY